MKRNKIILLQKSYGKKKTGDYSTSVAQSGNRSRVVFQYFFTMIFLYQDSLLHFHPFLVSVVNCYTKFLPLVYVPFFAAWQQTPKEVQQYVPLIVTLILVQTINCKNTARCCIGTVAKFLVTKRLFVGSKSVVSCVVCSHK